MRQSVFFGERRLSPSSSIRGDQLGHTLQIFSFKPLRFENLSHFLPLPVGEFINVTVLDLFEVLNLFVFGLCAQEIAGGHRKPVGENIGHAYDQDDPWRKLRADNSRYHSKGCH